MVAQPGNNSVAIAWQPSSGTDLDAYRVYRRAPGGAWVLLGVLALTGAARDLGITIITATHDHKMLKASHRIVWIKDGRVDRIENVADLTIEVGGMEHAGEFIPPAIALNPRGHRQDHRSLPCVARRKERWFL